MWELALEIAAPYIALAAKALAAKAGTGPDVTQDDIQAAHDARHTAEQRISDLASQIRAGGPPPAGKNP
jgi:hypothetical protein